VDEQLNLVNLDGRYSQGGFTPHSIGYEGLGCCAII
jgi:hypothetical protein